MDYLNRLSSCFEHYLSLHRVHPTKTYSYVAKDFHDMPVIEHTRYAPKCRNKESWVYVAIPATATLGVLAAGEHLYVGAQTQDRMFRGDNMDGENYHHAQMRSGNGSDNPISFLRSGREIAIHRAGAPALLATLVRDPALAHLAPLAQHATTGTRHLGWWFEQLLLYTKPGQWRWNTKGVEEPARSIIADLLYRESMRAARALRA